MERDQRLENGSCLLDDFVDMLSEQNPKANAQYVSYKFDGIFGLSITLLVSLPHNKRGRWLQLGRLPARLFKP